MKKNKIKVLCLSFWTPPLVRPQSILIGKMIPQWIKQGVEPIIMTYDSCGQWEINCPIYRIKQIKVNKYFNKFTILRELFVKRYYQKIYKYAEKIIRKHQPDIIFSFANPQDSNIIGAMLKERLGLKFVSHFSDPWVDNPYKKYTGHKTKCVKQQEKYIIDQSDRVIFTNQVALDLIMKKYPTAYRKKTTVISHCYDLKDYPSVIKKQSDHFVISHIGALSELRNPKPLLEAVQKAMNKEINSKEKIILRIIGAGTGDTSQLTLGQLQGLIAKYGLEDIAELIPPLSYKESLQEMSLADCLIVIDANLPGSPFLPSKVIDYAGSGSMIIGITPSNSPTAQFLIDLGYKSFNHDQVDNLANYLRKLIMGTTKPVVNYQFLNQYMVENTTKELINQFRKALTI